MNEIDAKLAQAVVLLDRQYLLTDHLIETRKHVLTELEKAIAEKRQTLEHVLDVYNFVFALIDNLVRYQKIASVLPRLSQKSPPFRALSAAMGDLKDIRNQLQHINNDIENDYSGPLLGSICWVAEQKQFIASFHDIGRSRSSPGIVLDAKAGKHVQEFCYVYNGVYYDLDRAIEGIRAFNKFINSFVSVEVNGKPYDTKEHFMALRIEFRLERKK